METSWRDIISPSIHPLTSIPAPISGSASPGVVSVEPDRKEILLDAVGRDGAQSHAGFLLCKWFTSGAAPGTWEWVRRGEGMFRNLAINQVTGQSLLEFHLDALTFLDSIYLFFNFIEVELIYRCCVNICCIAKWFSYTYIVAVVQLLSHVGLSATSRL